MIHDTKQNIKQYNNQILCLFTGFLVLWSVYYIVIAIHT